MRNKKKKRKLASVCVHAYCHFSRVQLFVTLWTVAHQAPLPMGFSRQECLSGLPCPPRGDLPEPGIKPASLTFPALAVGFFNTSTTWEAQPQFRSIKNKQCNEMFSLTIFESCRSWKYSSCLREAKHWGKKWKSSCSNTDVSKHLDACYPVDLPCGSPTRFFHFLSGFHN